VTVDVRLVTCANPPTEDPDTPIIAEALRGRGARVDIADWRDPAVHWASAPLTIIRSPWDYVDGRDEFVDWVRRAGEVSSVWNPPALIEWNTHKSYLLDLGRQGAPIVPTVLLLRESAASLDGICDAQGWNTVVVKPAVGIGALGAARFDVGDPTGRHHLDGLLQDQDVLVQPFVSSVVTDGELSVVVIDGAVTHALRKRPDAGDFRVHEEWGGELVADNAPASAQELALRVVGVLPTVSLYARIDMLAIGNLWHVLEVEATEPSLWLDHAPAAAVDRLAGAALARIT
jgi:glutathione synthase/RimK-type ligase-like ATP-grasp enzyme